MKNDTVLERILPLNCEAAIRDMIDISIKLCDICDRELEKLQEDNFVGVALIQDEKQTLSERYAQASQEFHDRLDTFKGTSPNLLKHLETLQETLGNKARANAVILEKMMNKLQQNTHTTLLNVQSMGQNEQSSYPFPVSGSLSPSTTKAKGSL